VPEFKRGDKVWAKIRGYSWWPARIGDVIEGRGPKDRKYRADFYGDGTHYTVYYPNVCDFITNY
jgi:hypothetical protein